MPCDEMTINEKQRAMREKALKMLAEELDSGQRFIRVVRNPVTGVKKAVISLKQGEKSWLDTACGMNGLQEGCAIGRLESLGWAAKARRSAGVVAREVHHGHKH